MESKKIIITGGLGFLGYSLLKKFQSKNNILVIDNLSSNVHKIEEIKNYKSCELINLDITDNKINKVIKSYNPDYIIHTAAQTSVINSINQPEKNNKINIDGTRNIIESVKELSDCFFMLISSGGAVYGNPDYLPVDENHILDPISPYGISKMEAEKITLEHLKDTKYKYSIIRPSNIYGAHQKEANVIPKFISLMKKNKTVSIYGDGNSTRDYVFIDDIVEIINKICEKKTEGIFNVSSNKEVKIIEIFNKLKSELDYKKNPKYISKVDGEIMNIYLDNSKILNLIRNFKFTNIGNGLKKTLSD